MSEAAALTLLADTLNGDFIHAIRTIRGLKGRLIVSGIGKSGHIARKIAATLASTGQPAYFVHAAEASHGDLGMITVDDGLLVLSSSGETQELKPLIAYARRFSIPIIGITRKSDSALATYATVPLILPEVDEACPMGLAPTTSTTMMLSLGDALAVCLLKAKKFSSRDYGL
ncbi:MAG: SIS domain-containing protein, partial [Alphaproteobacteria bacterium]|nr:SIS domain-containing protein [Alphaproteobacteria bacterium]